MLLDLSGIRESLRKSCYWFLYSIFVSFNADFPLLFQWNPFFFLLGEKHWKVNGCLSVYGKFLSLWCGTCALVGAQISGFSLILWSFTEKWGFLVQILEAIGPLKINTHEFREIPRNSHKFPSEKLKNTIETHHTEIHYEAFIFSSRPTREKFLWKNSENVPKNLYQKVWKI